jgi:hypothetical protein
MDLIRRVFRTLTNPCPGPGQAWRLQGVGPVFVHSINWGATPVTIELVLPNGEALRGWRLAQFRAQAALSEHDTGPALCFHDLRLVDRGAK